MRDRNDGRKKSMKAKHKRGPEMTRFHVFFLFCELSSSKTWTTFYNTNTLTHIYAFNFKCIRIVIENKKEWCKPKRTRKAFIPEEKNEITFFIIIIIINIMKRVAFRFFFYFTLFSSVLSYNFNFSSFLIFLQFEWTTTEI
jgi:hypothetical protein